MQLSLFVISERKHGKVTFAVFHAKEKPANITEIVAKCVMDLLVKVKLNQQKDATDTKMD